MILKNTGNFLDISSECMVVEILGKPCVVTTVGMLTFFVLLFGGITLKVSKEIPTDPQLCVFQIYK